jgi:hypothetical protein
MSENFWAYIDGLGALDDDDLYLDIDETMEKREAEKEKQAMNGCYGAKYK